MSIRPERGYGLVRLRKSLSLFANIRPVHLYPSLVHSTPLRPDVVAGVDFIIVRELTGGIYFAEPKQITGGPEGRAAVDTLAYTEQDIRRILRVGFRLAERRRRKVTSVDKFQILCSSDLWCEIADEVALEYPDVVLEHSLVEVDPARCA